MSTRSNTAGDPPHSDDLEDVGSKGADDIPEEVHRYLNKRFLATLDSEEIPCSDEARLPQSTHVDKAGGELWERHEPGLRRIVAFEMGDELYGVDILDAAEIMEMVPIMPVPNTQDFILGLINLRGTVAPVIDLRIRFKLNIKPRTPDGRIIVMRHGNLLVGVVVDRMWELLRIEAKDFQPVPPEVAQAQIDARFLKDVCKVKGHMLVVLDMGRILSETAQGGENAKQRQRHDAI